MTCSGLGNDVFGGCSMAWIGIVILFFIIAFARRYIGEEAGVPFSFIGALIGGGLGYIVILTITCSYKFALVGGLIGMVLLGFVFSQIFEGG
jgi:hypothetical protein